MKAVGLSSIFLLFAFACAAQVWPAEGSKLNYILAGFMAEKKQAVFRTEFKVAAGNFKNEEEFEKNIFAREVSDSGKALIKLPGYGQEYTWQYVTSNGDKTLRSGLIHFSTLSSVYVDPEQRRLKIIKPYGGTNLFFLLDYARVIYDMQGQAQWFLPDIPGHIDSGTLVRDMRVTPFGTITFLTDTGAYEIDYNARILWRGPKPADSAGKKKFGNYHHEFRRLNNGNYMLLGSEKARKKLPIADRSKLIAMADAERIGDDIYADIDYGTVVQYTPSGKKVWEWKSAGYFNNDEILWQDARGGYNATTHMNSFNFDEARKVIYVSFRDRDRIVKLRYPDNKILAEYGRGKSGGGLFSGQHSVMIDHMGDLYIYNNNVGPGKRNPVSSIQILKEPKSFKESLTVDWEFNCDIDSLAEHASTRGGNVTEVNSNEFFCCMGMSPRVLIADRNKKILFNAIAQNRGNTGWLNSQQYHAYPLYMASLGRIIFR